jgi:CHAD domain-containing protein
VAAALARAEYERRSARRSPRSKLQRATLAQIDLAIALLEGRSEVPPGQTVHETRKALKRARALVRLQRPALGAKRYRRLRTALRDCGRRLAVARDAEVVVDTLEELIRRHPKQLAHSPGVALLRERLIAERGQVEAHTRHGAPTRAAVLERLRATRLDLERWKPRQGDRATAREGLGEIYRQGRRRRKRARSAKTSASLHDWRKRVKDLRYAAEALKLREVARTADRLGETIGAEHDLWLLSQRLRRHRGCFKGDQAARSALRRLIAQRRRRLRKRAFRLGQALYRRPPKRFVRRALPK